MSHIDFTPWLDQQVERRGLIGDLARTYRATGAHRVHYAHPIDFYHGELGWAAKDCYVRAWKRAKREWMRLAAPEWREATR